MSTARERLTEALKDKPRGWRGDKGSQLLVEVLASDLRELANAAGDDPHAANLARGAAPFRNEKPDRVVYVQADDLYKLLEAGGQQPEPEQPQSQPQALPERQRRGRAQAEE